MIDKKQFTTIIVEDEKDAQLILFKYLSDNFKEIKILGICENMEDALQQIESQSPDLIFLDINLNGQNSFDLIKSLKAPFPKIIFTTAHNDYTIDAIRIKASDYLLKPIIKDEFINAVDRVIGDLNIETIKVEKEETLKKVVISTLEGKYLFVPGEIAFIEASGAYSVINFIDGRKKMTVSKPLNYFCRQLEGQITFLRCHKSFLVNLEQVDLIKTSIKTEIVLKNKFTIPIARSKRNELHEKIQLLLD